MRDLVHRLLSFWLRGENSAYYGNKKEVSKMILLTILLITLIAIAAVVLTITGVIGGAALALFGDLIVFVLIMWAIIKLIQTLRKKK